MPPPLRQHPCTVPTHTRYVTPGAQGTRTQGSQLPCTAPLVNPQLPFLSAPVSQDHDCTTSQALTLGDERFESTSRRLSSSPTSPCVQVNTVHVTSCLVLMSHPRASGFFFRLLTSRSPLAPRACIRRDYVFHLDYVVLLSAHLCVYTCLLIYVILSCVLAA